MKNSIKLICVIIILFGSNSVNANNKPTDTAMANKSYKIDSVVSKDGTKIGYRKYGNGTPLILVQGAMGITYNYDQLAKALSNNFTVYVPERRGRKLSPKEYTAIHSIDREVEDLSSLIDKTGCRFIFGLSSGAIITLEALNQLTAIDKVILYEPPFYATESVPVKKIDNLFKQIEKNKIPDAMVSALKIVKVGPSFFNYAPRFLLKMGTKQFLRKQEKKGVGEYEYAKNLIPSMRFDFKMVLERGSMIDSYKNINKPILLLGGSKSPKYLKAALTALEQTISSAIRTEFIGLDHNAPWNIDEGGSPQIVANEIIKFLNK
jgi:pimeloyl-ACP methyl ester carboxylesterase